MMNTEDTLWDVIVIGGGAAGLSAAQALGRSLRRTLVVDAGSPRNRFAAHLHNALGLDGTPPAELLERGRREASAYGVEFCSAEVSAVREDPAAGRDSSAPRLLVELAGGEGGSARTLRARAVVAATGAADGLPEIPGLAERWGRTVLHCPYCHGWEVRGGRIAVLATSPLSMHQARLLRQWSDDVLVFSAELGPVADETAAQLAARGVRLEPSPVASVSDAGAADEGALLVRTENGGEHVVDAVFTAGTLVPHDGFLNELDLARADNLAGSFIAVDAMGITSHPRVWAVGNVTNPMAPVPLAASAGTMAGAAANGILVEEDFALALAERTAADRPHEHAHVPSASAREPREGEAPVDFWERRYSDAASIWSGRVNASLARAVADLPPGRSLDLGCGEGGDVIWLAEHDWDATGIDLSTTAVGRARAAAAERGLDRATFVAADLGEWVDDPARVDGGPAPFDLVTASFLQSPVEMPRERILRTAAERVAVGGHLVLVAHAAAPAWAEGRHGPGDFPSPDEELATLALDPEAWRVVTAEIRTREAAGPDGRVASLEDTVVVARRIG